MDTWRLAFVLLVLAHGLAADTIAQYYTNTQAGRFIIAPAEPYLAQTLFNGLSTNYTSLFIYPTYRFDDNSTGWANGQIYVPSTVDIPLSSCAFTYFSRISVFPAACDGGLLLYGYINIGPVPNNTDLVNNVTAGNPIVGQTVTRLDSGYPNNQRGTVRWFRPIGCPDTASFFLELGIGTMNDVADVVPLTYTDSGTGTSLNPVAVGLGCSSSPRPAASAIYNPQPYFAPICRGFLPFTGAVNATTYGQLFGSIVQPVNVPLGAIVYQVRFDNLFQDLQVYAQVRFTYPDNTEDDYTIYPGYNNIYYLISNGTLPALAKICYYEEPCTPAFAWNEVLLGYLAPCNCNPGNPNVPCNTTLNEVEMGPHARADIPNFNAAQSFIANPTCVFAINPPNGTNPIANVPFQVQGLSTGGAGPISYAWQLANLPPSGGQIQGSTIAPTITVVAFATSTFSIFMTVTAPGSTPQTCNQTITIVAGAPTACVTPTIINNMIVSTFVGLDAGCSTDPMGGMLSYLWTIAASPFPYTGGSVTPTTSPTTSFSCTDVGTYIVALQVNNTVASASAQVTIFCIPIPPPPPPPGAPISPPTTPFSCGPPVPPFALPAVPPTSPPPLGPIPIPPGSTPPPVVPNPAVQPPSGTPLTPATADLLSTMTGILIAVVVLITVAGLCSGLSRLLRQNMNSNWGYTQVDVNKTA